MAHEKVNVICENLCLEEGMTKEQIKNEIDVERQRINNMTHLEEGSTTGDAELIDIRVGFNGKIYNNAGTAVRTQVDDLNNALDDVLAGKNIEKMTVLNNHFGIIHGDGHNYDNPTSSQNTIYSQLLDYDDDKIFNFDNTKYKAVFVVFDNQKNFLRVSFWNDTGIMDWATYKVGLPYSNIAYYAFEIRKINDENFDNSDLTKTLIYSNKVVENNLGTKCFYVSPNGNDENSGLNPSMALATIDRALQKGASKILCLGGKYLQTINLTNASKKDISISSYEKDKKVVFINPNAVIANSELSVSGYNNVYKCTTNKNFSSSNVLIFQDGINDTTTLIGDAERHPLERGYEYRCSDTKIERCSATSLNEALTEISTSQTYKWYLDGNTLYFSRPRQITSSNPLCMSDGAKFITGNSRDISLKMTGIEAKYMCFYVGETINSVISECKASNVYGAGAFVYDKALNCTFLRCEASRAFNGEFGDGFNGHASNTGDVYSKQTTVSLIDCWSHDNNDDGYSDHERSETSIFGGLYEYNGKAGITPSYGSHCTCHNVYSRNNYNGFYYIGSAEAAEGGKYGQMICYDCVAENNTRGGTKSGFKVDGVGNNLILVNCKSINNDIGYSAHEAIGRMKIIDCTAYGNRQVKNGTKFEIINTSVVS